MRPVRLALVLSLLMTPCVAATQPATHARREAQRKRSNALIIAGTSLFAAGYTTSLALSLTAASIGSACGTEPNNPCDAPTRWLVGVAPLAGPWVQIAYAHGSPTSFALYGIPGLVQLGGIGVWIAGVAPSRF